MIGPREIALLRNLRRSGLLCWGERKREPWSRLLCQLLLCLLHCVL